LGYFYPGILFLLRNPLQILQFELYNNNQNKVHDDKQCKQVVDLTSTTLLEAESMFQAQKWDIENNYDYVQV